MPELTHDTLQTPEGGFQYRILSDGEPVLISGVFNRQSDAASCGAHIASDPAAVFDYIERKSNGAR